MSRNCCSVGGKNTLRAFHNEAWLLSLQTLRGISKLERGFRPEIALRQAPALTVSCTFVGEACMARRASCRNVEPCGSRFQSAFQETVLTSGFVLCSHRYAQDAFDGAARATRSCALVLRKMFLVVMLAVATAASGSQS